MRQSTFEGQARVDHEDTTRHHVDDAVQPPDPTHQITEDFRACQSGSDDRRHSAVKRADVFGHGLSRDAAGIGRRPGLRSVGEATSPMRPARTVFWGSNKIRGKTAHTCGLPEGSAIACEDDRLSTVPYLP